MSGYSATSLVKKLGLKPGMTLVAFEARADVRFAASCEEGRTAARRAALRMTTAAEAA